ncbi:MAG: SDR family NAD(P)-dependent oxidoreductase [Tepidamorphaceae bacterium]|nr:SDR family NAD(P)-dependent oxidoreductase [Rhodobiaceae bacterium]MCC0048212.1 SDR family NAD(P)-dependent oxidoreductase [Rhodobiaceae bacterium]
MTRTALVTGANRGIGASIAKGLATQGLRVIAAVRDLASAEKTLNGIRKVGGEALAVEFDAGEPGSIRACVAALERDGEQVDVLVNNAGILEGERLLDMDEAGVLRSVQINALGPLLLIRLLAPGMVKRGYGRIVNMSSGWGSLEDLGPGAYGVSKALLNAITVKTAEELPACVKVNAMCPGWVNTQMGGTSAPRTPQQGADTAIWLAMLADDAPSGAFFRDRKKIGWDD